MELESLAYVDAHVLVDEELEIAVRILNGTNLVGIVDEVSGLN
jgi:hypothetical protein